MTAKSFGTLFARLGERAGMAFPIFPHMLRHACGFALANAGHDTRRALQAWLGHKNIQHTVRYTETRPRQVQELLAVGLTPPQSIFGHAIRDRLHLVRSDALELRQFACPQSSLVSGILFAVWAPRRTNLGDAASLILKSFPPAPTQKPSLVA